MVTKTSSRQIVNKDALSSIGSSAGEQLNSVLSKIDANILSTIAEVNTGHVSWSSVGPYYSVTGGNTFNLLVGGSGYILNKLVNFNGSQSVTLTANKTAYVGINTSGTLVKTDHDSINSTTYENQIILFEALYDGTNVIVVKENHPYSFPSKLSTYLHQNVGTVIRGTGAVIGKLGTGTGASTTDRQLKITGIDSLEDHGLSTTIPDSSAAAITVTYMYKNASGQWIKYSSQNTTPLFYAPAGVITAIPASNYENIAVYVSKDDLNSSTPTYFAVLDTQVYTSASTASTAISNGTLTLSSNELSALELCQLGYITIRNSGGGYIDSVIVSKSTFNSKLVGGGAAVTSHLLLSDLSGGPYNDGGHSNLMNCVTKTTDPTVSDDSSLYKLGTKWINTTTQEEFTLMDSTIGSAIWVSTGSKAAIKYSIIF